VKKCLVTVGLLTALLTSCSDKEDVSESFTIQLPPTSITPVPTENICPIAIHNVCSRSYSKSADKFAKRKGKVVGTTQVVTAQDTRGAFIAEPAAMMQKGRYEIVFEYHLSGEEPGKQSENDRYDIVHVVFDPNDRSKYDVIVLQEGVLPFGSDPLRLSLKLEEAVKNFQFRVIYGGVNTITAKQLTITALDDTTE